MKYLFSIVLGTFMIMVFSSTIASKNRNITYLEKFTGDLKDSLDSKMEWWEEAKFGMFIHWGVYSVPAGFYHDKEVPGAGEWIMNWSKIPVAEYKGYAAEFNPVAYDPEAWVKMAKNAGMKYIVITSKHHDGFALFDSKVTDWDVADATPYGKDLLKPLVEACRKEGIRIGFYYSQAQDWNHPGGAANSKLMKEDPANPKATKINQFIKEHHGHWDPVQDGNFDDYLDSIAVPQVKEILSDYGDIDILWWDTPTNMTKERAKKFLPVLKEHPNLITNNRLGGGIEGDTETPEQSVPATGYPNRHWEVCMTMNSTWGFKKNNHNWKSGKDLILKLSEIVSKGGNFLLNVGPTSKGEIPQPSIELLKQIGDWMKTNHEAIYGTLASPFPYLPWGRATLKGQKLYLHVVSWPKDGLLQVPLQNKALRAYLLADPVSNLKFEQDGERIEVKVSEQAPDSILPIIVLEFEGDPKVLSIPSAGRTGKASSVDPKSSVSNLFDGDPKNEWKPAKGVNTAWVEVDLIHDVSICNFSITEPWHPWENHGQEFDLQYKKGNEWIDLVSGKTNGCGHTQAFNPVTARYFRLVITGANDDVPVLNEWVLNRALSSSVAKHETDSRLHAVGKQWNFYQASDTTKSKRVLLIGDSVLGGYSKDVSTALKDEVAVDLWVTPLNEGSPDLFPVLKLIMSHGPYDAIHFNIGLHGWQKGRVDDTKYESIMQQYVDILKKGSPNARLIWATTTPVTEKGDPLKLNEEINPIIVKRNKMAKRVMKRNHVKIDDLYGLMVKNLSTARGDMFHWKPEGIKLQSEAVVKALNKNL